MKYFISPYNSMRYYGQQTQVRSFGVQGDISAVVIGGVATCLLKRLKEPWVIAPNNAMNDEKFPPIECGYSLRRAIVTWMLLKD